MRSLGNKVARRLDERVDVGGRRVHDGNPVKLSRLAYLRGETLERAGTGPRTGLELEDTVSDLEDRLYVEQAPEQGLG